MCRLQMLDSTGMETSRLGIAGMRAAKFDTFIVRLSAYLLGALADILAFAEGTSESQGRAYSKDGSGASERAIGCSLHCFRRV